MNNSNEHHKVRCTCNHVVLHYDVQGLHLRCRHCKMIKSISWAEVLRMYTDVGSSPEFDARVLHS